MVDTGIKSGRSKTLEQIFAGEAPKFSASHLRKRLLREGVKPHQCEVCLLTEWLGKPIPLELHHKNGNAHDNSFTNLELVCPNCHAQTDTYKSKNIGNGVRIRK